MKSSVQLNDDLNADAEQQSVLSKVLINEHDKAVVESLKKFLNDNRMVGYKVSKDRIFRVLASSVDLGAVFLPEFDNRGNTG